jgi:fibronectin-binding autotransporter adhesin
MRKILSVALVLAGAFLFAPAARAQFTTVTATVKDPNGIPYAGAVLNAILVPSTGGGYTLSGNPYSGRIGPVTLDSSGSFTVNFGDVTLISPGSPQWQITIDSAAATISLPLGTGPQSFTYTSTGTTISGSSPVSLTTALNALAPKLTNFASGGSGTISCSISAAVLFETAANTAGCASTLTFSTTNKLLLVGDPTSGLAASTSLPVGNWAVQAIHQNSATTAQDTGVLGVVEADSATASGSNHINGGYFSANALTNLFTGSGGGPLQGVQGVGVTSHPTGNMAQVLGGLFSAFHTGAGTTTDLAGLASQCFVTGSGLVGACSAIRVYNGGITGGTPPTGNYGIFINPMTGGVNNWAINISNQVQDSSHWAVQSGTGKVEFGDQLILHGPLNFPGSSSGTAGINVPAAAGSPCTILLPTTSPSANQFLQSAAASSGNCQTTWATPSAGTIAIPATVSGATSGGIPCFDSTTDMNSTVAITVNDAITGGGAGACAKDSNVVVYRGARTTETTNVAIGTGALAANGSGTDVHVTAIGMNALNAEAGTFPSSNNTAIGWTALLAENGSNGSNTAIGSGALNSLTTASSNVAVGSTAGNNITTGNSNVFIGTTTRASANSDTNEIAVGNAVTGAGSNTATIGNASVTDVHHGGAADAAAVHAKAYDTASNCSSSASPAVCGSATAGSVAVPTGTNATLVVNTTSVTANSQIFVQSDDTLGTKLGITCNSTLASLIVEPVVSARTGGTSFTITISGTTTTNPVCLSYFIVN